MAEQQQARQVPLDERSGAPNWPGVLALAGRVAAAGYLSADEAAMLKERLKSEAPHVVLNTLTVSASLLAPAAAAQPASANTRAAARNATAGAAHHHAQRAGGRAQPAVPQQGDEAPGAPHQQAAVPRRRGGGCAAADRLGLPAWPA